MSDWADNYDELATVDDGSCVRLGCMSDWAYNFDPIATLDDGLCYPIVYGCLDDAACNYIPLTDDNHADANTDDGSCMYLDGVCETCDNGVILDNDSDNDGLCNDLDTIYGCKIDVPIACNYNPSPTVNIDNTLCTLLW